MQQCGGGRVNSWNLLVGGFDDEQMLAIFWLNHKRAWESSVTRTRMPSCGERSRARSTSPACGWRRRTSATRSCRSSEWWPAHLPAGPDGRVHYGATTQDILDSALACPLRDSLSRLEELLQTFGDHLARLPANL